MRQRFGQRLGMIFIAVGLVSCNSLDQRKGISPILMSSDVQDASVNKNLVLRALAADAGLHEGGGINWYLVSEAGFNYIDDRCRAYFDDLFFLDRGREQVKSGLSAASQTTAAILGVTGASSATLAIVAQAFGFSVNATELLAGTYLYQLPPATTQGFVQKLQLAFRDAAAAKRQSINSPTVAYHIIQRYLDLCLPPRIEAEITKQISSTTAFPVVQGSGALFSIETVSTPPSAALRPTPLLIPPVTTVAREFSTRGTRRADEPLPSRVRTPEEKALRGDETRIFFVSQVQKALCEPPTGTVGPSTLNAIKSYLRARPGRIPENLDPMASNMRPRLVEAVTDVVDCKAAGFKNAYEVGRFGVPDSKRVERIRRMQNALRDLLKERGSSVAVESTGAFDGQTRDGIAELRRLTGTAGNEIDFRLDQLLQS